LVIPLMIRGVLSTAIPNKANTGWIQQPPVQNSNQLMIVLNMNLLVTYGTMEDQALASIDCLQKTGDRTHTHDMWVQFPKVSYQHKLLLNKRVKAILCCLTYHPHCVNIHLQMSQNLWLIYQALKLHDEASLACELLSDEMA
jgi:hypothetical protein